MIELAQLFQDLDVLVVQQERLVMNMEQKGEEVVDNVTNANEQIDTAIKSARSRNRKKWWCLLVVGEYTLCTPLVANPDRCSTVAFSTAWVILVVIHSASSLSLLWIRADSHLSSPHHYRHRRHRCRGGINPTRRPKGRHRSEARHHLLGEVSSLNSFLSCTHMRAAPFLLPVLMHEMHDPRRATALLDGVRRCLEALRVWDCSASFGRSPSLMPREPIMAQSALGLVQFVLRNEDLFSLASCGYDVFSCQENPTRE